MSAFDTASIHTSNQLCYRVNFRYVRMRYCTHPYPPTNNVPSEPFYKQTLHEPLCFMLAQYYTTSKATQNGDGDGGDGDTKEDEHQWTVSRPTMWPQLSFAMRSETVRVHTFQCAADGIMLLLSKDLRSSICTRVKLLRTATATVTAAMVTPKRTNTSGPSPDRQCGHSCRLR